MKQNLEEAAKMKALEICPIEGESTRIFIMGAQFGAEWQANQSPWHEVSEEPKKGEHICVQVGSGNLTSWYAPSNIRKAFEDHNAIRWAYVSDLIKPTTQSINS